jgi:hypothetical protein
MAMFNGHADAMDTETMSQLSAISKGSRGAETNMHKKVRYDDLLDDLDPTGQGGSEEDE